MKDCLDGISMFSIYSKESKRVTAMKLPEYNNSYERTFEDFVEDKVPNKNNKGKHIERKYVGFYYCQELNKRKRNLTKGTYVILYLLSGFLIFFAASRRIPFNQSWYGGVLAGIDLLLMLSILIPLIFYIIAPERMTIYEYKSTSLRLEKLALYTAISLAVTAIAVSISIFVIPNGEERTEFLCICSFTLSAIFMYIIQLIERKIVYQQLHNPNGRINENQ